MTSTHYLNKKILDFILNCTRFFFFTKYKQNVIFEENSLKQRTYMRRVIVKSGFFFYILGLYNSTSLGLLLFLKHSHAKLPQHQKTCCTHQSSWHELPGSIKPLSHDC